jgi:hypothetical protein
MASMAGSLRKAPVGPGTKEKENHAMTRLNSNRSDATMQQPAGHAEFDPCLIDDEFDDFLDRELFAIRESLADFRNV